MASRAQRTGTAREQAKADRQASLLRESARLFAERGFAGVSLEELGAAVGISGPAVYRHFPSKQALLGAILVEVSERLLVGGHAVVARGGTPREQLRALVAFHTDFALSDADVIRVQDRDLASLSDDDRHRVRRLQREYVDVWVGVLAEASPATPPFELRIRAHACFGLLNSTPHSVRGLRAAPDDGAVRNILSTMASAALASVP